MHFICSSAEGQTAGAKSDIELKRRENANGCPTEFLLMLLWFPGRQHAIHLLLFQVYFLPTRLGLATVPDPSLTDAWDYRTSTRLLWSLSAGSSSAGLLSVACSSSESTASRFTSMLTKPSSKHHEKQRMTPTAAEMG